MTSSEVARTWSSSDSASRMPPPARRAMRSMASGRRAAALRLEDAPQLAPDLVLRERPEGEPLEPLTDRRADLAGVGGAEHEQDALGWLLERLEQDVPALLDALDLVDDEHLAPQVGRRGVHPGHQLAHVVDAVVGCRVELDDVERAALADGDAVGARVARLAVAEVGAVDRLGEDPRGRGLAGAAGTHEQQPMPQPPEADRVAKGLDDGPLADHLAERLGPEPSVDRQVRRGRARFAGRLVGHHHLGSGYADRPLGRAGRDGHRTGARRPAGSRDRGAFADRLRPGVTAAVDREGASRTGRCPGGREYLPCTLCRPRRPWAHPERSARTRPVRGTRRAALNAASFRT